MQKQSNINLKNVFILISILLHFSTNGQELVKIIKVDSISILFKSGSSTINNSNIIINELNKINVMKLSQIKIKAYTDTIGSIEFNKKLASKRLNETIKLLKETKINTIYFDTLNQNENHNVINNKIALSRRVDIVIYKIEPVYKLDQSIILKIYFQPDSDKLIDNESNATLIYLKTILLEDTTLNIKLNGHVAKTPDLTLSLNRALRIKEYLVKNGISSKKINCEGFSNKKPIVPATTEENLAINRRVEVIFMKKKK